MDRDGAAGQEKIMDNTPQTAITNINAITNDLAVARDELDLPRILEIRSRLKAAQVFAESSNWVKAANIAKEGQLRADRCAGEVLREMPKAEPGRPPKIGTTMVPISTLSDYGISKNQSSRWQLTADLPEKQFEAIIAKSHETERELTSKEVMNAAKEFRHKKRREEMASEVIDCDETIQAAVSTGDFREIMAEMADNSIDMIFTDPPYDKKSIPLYGDMARIAARVLKPGGSLITYVGHYAIGEVYKLMEPHLRFWWVIALVHSGNSARLPGKWIYVEWKPLLWFVKGGRNNNNNFVADLFESKQPEKVEHDWQQDVSEAEYYINNLTVPGAMILDPFAGSGTTLIAALKTGRQAIGIELDEARANVCRKRIKDYTG